jgi:hypothetical protein
VEVEEEKILLVIQEVLEEEEQQTELAQYLIQVEQEIRHQLVPLKVNQVEQDVEPQLMEVVEVVEQLK